MAELAPRLLDAQKAADYCGLTVRTFNKEIPVQPVKIGSNELWDKNTLDAYIDGLSGSSTAQKPVDWTARAQAF